MCVLVVEDELLIRMDLALTLEDAGHEVLCASNGPDALAIAAIHSQRLTAVLSDFRMPGGMNGVDVVSSLRTICPTIPMFIVTAQASAVPLAFVAQHKVGIIGKPYDPFRLVETLALAITNQRRA